MANLSEDLKIVISGDPKKFNKALDEVQANTKRMEAGLSAAMKVSGVAFAALTGTVGGLIAAYRQQEIQEQKTHAMIQATGGAAGITANELFKMASALQEVTTFGDETIMAATNIFLGFDKIGGETFPKATEAALNLATFMGGDLTAAAKMLGKALQDPAEGLSQLGRAGIKFTNEQERQIKAMAESGQVAEAQAIILNTLEGRMGGLARSSAEGSGKLLQLKNVIGDVAEEIGRQLTPKIAAASAIMIPFFKAAAESESFTKSAAAVLLFGTVLSGLVFGLSAAVLGIVKFTNVIQAAWLVIKGITLASVGWAVAIAVILVAITDLALNWDKRMSQIKSAWASVISYITGNPIPVEKTSELFGAVEKAHQGHTARIAKNEADHQARMLTANTVYLEAKKKLEDDYKNLRMQAQFTDAQQIELAERQHRNNLLNLANEFSRAEAELKITDEQVNMEQELAFQTELANMKNEERLAELDAARQLELEKAKIQQQANLQYIKDREKFGVAYAKINRMINSEYVQGVSSALSDMVQMQQSTNSTLKAIGKVAAIADITIKTAQAAMNIYAGFSTIPIIGPALGVAGAAAAVAFGAERISKVTAAADGGVMAGGRRGVDSIPTLTMPGEIITPSKNYDEHINAVADKRNREQGVAASVGQQTFELIIGFQDNAFRIIRSELEKMGALRV